MPTKLRKLKEEAVISCTKRLHNMGNFIGWTGVGHKEGQRIHTAYCKYCRLYVQVILRPLPNEINIGGNAVAITCPNNPYKEPIKARLKSPIIN